MTPSSHNFTQQFAQAVEAASRIEQSSDDFPEIGARVLHELDRRSAFHGPGVAPSLRFVFCSMVKSGLFEMISRDIYTPDQIPGLITRFCRHTSLPRSEVELLATAYLALPLFAAIRRHWPEESIPAPFQGL